MTEMLSFETGVRICLRTQATDGSLHHSQWPKADVEYDLSFVYVWEFGSQKLLGCFPTSAVSAILPLETIGPSSDQSANKAQ